jgi:hypothetical protein
MAQRTQHVVTANLIVAQTKSVERYFDKGAVLTDDVPTEEKKRLVGLGLVEVQKIEVETTTPSTSTTEQPKDPAKEPGQDPAK